MMNNKQNTNHQCFYKFIHHSPLRPLILLPPQTHPILLPFGCFKFDNAVIFKVQLFEGSSDNISSKFGIISFGED